jgi:hypothetical protein
VGDDDTHNAMADGETGVCWTMIHTNGKADRKELTKSLKQGRAFGVTGKRGQVGIYPLQYSIEADTALIVVLSDTAKNIEMIGQNGKLMQSDSNVKSTRYAFRNSDTYIRVRIHSDSSILWMNPVIRGDGRSKIQPTINTIQTFAYRGAWFTGYAIIGLLIFRLKRRK